MKKYSKTEEAVIDAENSLLQSYLIGREMTENLGDQSNWRNIAIVTKEAILQIYDAIFEFVYPEDDSWNRAGFDTKTKKLGEMKILNDIYESDLLRVNEIRRECAHKIKIDEKLIKSKCSLNTSFCCVCLCFL